MNKLVVCLLCVVSLTSFGNVADDYVEDEKSSARLSPEVFAAAGALLGREMASNLLHAVRLNMAKYDRDMKSKSGREAWHGKLVSQEINTNGLYKVEVYSNEVDGAVWRYRMPFRGVDLQASVKAANERLKTTMTNGIPARLAAARLRRQAEIVQGVSNVTVTVTAGND